MRTLLVDDHSLFRQGLKYLLGELDETVDFIEADSCEQALKAESPENVQLVLLDYHMPGSEGVEALNAIRKVFTMAVVVILSSEDDPGLIRETIDSGASGFIQKSSTPEVLVAALRLILAGGTYLPRNALNGLETAPTGEKNPADLAENTNTANLSNRQRDVLKLVIQGKANKVVAREMGISEGTVKAHLSAAFRAIGVKNRTEAVFKAAQLGLALDTKTSR